MTPERWAQVDRIHKAALDRAATDRAAYLDAACAGDAELRREVESLLAYATAAEGFLERPAVQETARSFEADVDAGAGVLPIVTGYTVIELLGTGGMGVVYLANEDPPLRRRVALKLIRPGMDSLSALARFEAERQALALMDHPNIAAVYGTGVSADRRPFVAMEFVAGKPITEYCDRARLSIRARLNMFVRVCAAIQHAHQKGVIHRDLKPSNVLVTDHDGEPVPKVIDFGTAAWADRPRAAHLGLTEAGTVVGTLEYMSPEQAAASPDIDTTTDVYSLGVLLYELLVGEVPFDRQHLRAASYDEMRRVILESDPPRPSSQLTRDKPSTSSAADARSTDVGRLTRQLAGDLDWIVLRALEKDRRRRYPTVAAFAADVDRYLNDQPVDARPPSAGYRISKFARRHVGAVSAAAALLVVLVAGFLTSTTLYFRAEQARADADRQRADADRQRLDADEQRAIAGTQRSAAERAAAEATTGRNEALAANAESDRLRGQAVKQVSAVNASLREAEYRTYVATVAAADGDLRSDQPNVARQRLLAVPEAQRGWEWQHLLLRTDSSLIASAGAPCDSRFTYAPLQPRALTDPLVLVHDGTRIDWIRCNVLDQWDTAVYGHTATIARPLTRFLGANSTGLRLIVSKHLPTGWDLELTGRPGDLPALTFGPFEKEPACASISADGARIGVGLEPPNSPLGENLEDVFEVWSTAAVRLIVRVLPPRPPLRDTRSGSSSCMIRFSPDGSRFATSGGTVHVWASESGAELRADTDQAGVVAQPLAFSPDGTQLAVGRNNGLVDVLNLVSTTNPTTHLDGNGIVRPLPLPDDMRLFLTGYRKENEVWSVAFSPDATKIVSAFSNQVGVWDVPQGKLVKVLAGHEARVASVLVGADGHFIFSADTSGILRAWATDATTGVTRLPGSSTFYTNPVLRRDGGAIAFTGPDTSVSVWLLDDLRQIILRPGIGRLDSQNSSRPAALTPDGRYLLVTEGNAGRQTVKRWTIATAESLTVPIDDQQPACDDARPRRFDGSTVLSNDGRYLAFRDGLCVLVWDLSAMKTVATLNLRRGAETQLTFAALRFRPDGALLVSSMHSRPSTNRIHVWDWRTNHLDKKMERVFNVGDVATVWNPVMSPDGSRIAMNDGGQGIAIWDGELTRELGRLPVSGPIMPLIAFSPDASRIVSVTNDPVVRVWDTRTFEQLLALTDIEGHPFGAGFTPDGRIIAGRASGGFTIWETKKTPCAVCEEKRIADERARQALEARLRADRQVLESADCSAIDREVPPHSQREFGLNPRRTCWTPWLLLGESGDFDLKESANLLVQLGFRDGTIGDPFEDGPTMTFDPGKPVQKIRFKSLGKGPVTITLKVR